METKALVVRTWDDLVFANRNRDYGAYTIRKAYSRRVIISFGISTAMMAALLLFMQINRDIKIADTAPPEKGRLIILDPPPMVEHIRPPRVEPRPQTTTTRTNTTIQVVTTPVATQPIEVDAEPVSLVDGTATGVDLPSDGVGQGEVPVVAAPPVPEVVTHAEVMPEYEGGFAEMMKFLKSKFRYPASARRLEIEGTVYVSFIVNGNGTVRDVTVLRGISSDCDKEAVRVISLLNKWKGGSQNGYPVSVRMVLPITFSLAK